VLNRLVELMKNFLHRGAGKPLIRLLFVSPSHLLSRNVGWPIMKEKSNGEHHCHTGSAGLFGLKKNYTVNIPRHFRLRKD
jgi:hypothetical protein